jgi:amidohydrolase
MKSGKQIKKLAEKFYDRMVADRRHLHRYPELSFCEYETTRFVTDRLKSLGYQIHQPLETGVVAVIENGPVNGRVVALRADIDALPILEEGEAKLPFISQRPGIAHCCGHDIHTANLLGTAAILAELRNQIRGRVVLVFQPAEEKLPGGALGICNTGILDSLAVSEVYGLHTDPNLGPGQIGIRSGWVMAQPDEFSISVKGVGGHAASPHLCVDPILILAQIIVQIQAVVSRNINPSDPAVVTVAQIEGGTAHNIIPAIAGAKGTVRTFRADTANMIHKRLELIVKNTAAAHGAEAEFSFTSGYPAVVNSETETERVAQTARNLFGLESVHRMDEPYMAGEDFSHYLDRYKGAFFFLGSGSKAADAIYAWHHPRYNADEQCLITGSAILASIVLSEG